ncbi:MAG: glycosyl transferase [Bacteroidales bacterium]|nr:glycosyl transferase [Bacteroidales bacterium]
MGFLYFKGFGTSVIEKHDNDAFFSTRGETLLRLEPDSGLFGKDPVCIKADPFLFVRGGELFLFYEYQKKRYGKGEIWMRKTADLEHWSEDIRVLKEDFHLSFPNVFEDGGRVYMIPETGEDGSIRLYEASDDSLEHWKFVGCLVSDGRMWADSDIRVKDGKYYLFSSIYSRKYFEAHLLVSDSLLGDYAEHPSSPFSTDKSCARNAGRLFEYNGELYRPVQNCSKGYGKQLSIMKVGCLSPDRYEESLCAENIVDTDIAFYKRGGHQFCPVSFKGRTIVATDAIKRIYNILENLNGYCHHLCKRG